MFVLGGAGWLAVCYCCWDYSWGQGLSGVSPHWDSCSLWVITLWRSRETPESFIGHTGTYYQLMMNNQPSLFKFIWFQYHFLHHPLFHSWAYIHADSLHAFENFVELPLEHISLAEIWTWREMASWTRWVALSRWNSIGQEAELGSHIV